MIPPRIKIVDGHPQLIERAGDGDGDTSRPLSVVERWLWEETQRLEQEILQLRDEAGSDQLWVETLADLVRRADRSGFFPRDSMWSTEADAALRSFASLSWGEADNKEKT